MYSDIGLGRDVASVCTEVQNVYCYKSLLDNHRAKILIFLLPIFLPILLHLEPTPDSEQHPRLWACADQLMIKAYRSPFPILVNAWPMHTQESLERPIDRIVQIKTLAIARIHPDLVVFPHPT